MSPWTLRILDVAASALLVGGIALCAVAWFARRPSFAARVAQGRVSEEAPSPVSAWARRVSAAALESLGSTTQSVARRLALAGMAPEVSVFRLRQALAGIAGFILACLALCARPASSLRASIVPLCACALVGTLLGVAGMDRFLTVRAHARQRAIDVAVPDCAELLALAVAAGGRFLPPSSGLRGVRVGHWGWNCPSPLVISVTVRLPCVRSPTSLSAPNRPLSRA